MSQDFTESERPAVHAGAVPPMTWNGTLVSSTATMKHYLHLSAFPCQQCNGPVIAGWMGTRDDGISQETNVRKVGAACIACGFRPETIPAPAVGLCFRPAEWKWTIKDPALGNACPAG